MKPMTETPANGSPVWLQLTIRREALAGLFRGEAGWVVDHRLAPWRAKGLIVLVSSNQASNSG